MKKLIYLSIILLLIKCQPTTPDFSVNVSFSEEASAVSLDGRLILMLSTDDSKEPRFQISDNVTTQIVFGQNVNDMSLKTPLRLITHNLDTQSRAWQM